MDGLDFGGVRGFPCHHAPCIICKLLYFIWKTGDGTQNCHIFLVSQQKIGFASLSIESLLDVIRDI